MFLTSRRDDRTWELDSALTEPCQTLLELGIDGSDSHVVEPVGTPHISYTASVGGFTYPDLVAAAIEREARNEGNKKKLAQPRNATRRHIFVVFHGSTGSSFIAAYHGTTGRLPSLEPPVTTAWAWAAPTSVLVTTPPSGWEEHKIPSGVRDAPHRWLHADDGTCDQAESSG